MALRRLAGLLLATATAVVAAGVEPAGGAELPPALDLTKPTAAVAALPAFAAASSLTVSYSGKDEGSGVKSYDVRYRVAPWRGSFGDYATPAGGAARTATSLAIAVRPGSDYCVSVRSRDRNDNVSDWTADTCSANALDDRSLAAKGRWTRVKDAASYGGTVTKSATFRSSLTVAARGKQMALVLTTCPSCGKLAIVLDGSLWRVVDTRSARTAKRVIAVQPAALGTVSTRITLGVYQNRTVIVDGLAVTSR